MQEKWEDLRFFLAVAREGGLSSAGRVLKADAATVGRHITRLEQTMDRALFAKSPQGYELTQAGLDLFPRIEAMEAELRAGLAGLKDDGEGLSGTIRIGATDGCANYLLPPICARLARKNPDLDIQILTLPRVVNVSRREADMAIAVSAPTAGRLMVQKIADYSLHLAAVRGYLKNNPPIETIADLKGHRVVGYIPDMIFDKELDYLSGLGLDRVNLASSSATVQLQMIMAGGGIGVMHDFMVRNVNRIRWILPDQVSFKRSFYLVRHQDDRHSSRLQRFSDALVREMRESLTETEQEA